MFNVKIYSCLISLLVAIGIYAQTPTATLSGVVRDVQQGGIPAATVKVRQIATGKTRAIRTDNEGIEYGNRGNLPNASLLFPGVTTFGGRFDQRTVGGPAATAAALTFLATGRTPAAGAPTLNDTLDANIRTPYTTQASLQLSQELPGGLALTAGYLYVHGVKLLGHTPSLNGVADTRPA